ncbi:hypothetical protein L6164_011522 [Bauhinia variegata]|uniref:Uncharacterized protein n=1 Tax=Bauhinia variegata TaxID=167791 RepID=A0ACB9P7I2_BAUVA|nr:hypothetical protein L6164_011522 [Bauhinia variegata]
MGINEKMKEHFRAAIPVILLAMAFRLPYSSLFFTGSCQKLIHKRKFAAQYSPGIFNSNGNGLIQKGFRHQKYVIPRKKITIIQAVSIPVAPSSADGAEYRKQLSESYGFRQIGESLPDNVTLKDIVDSFPKSVFEIDDVKAWKSVLISATSYALGSLGFPNRHGIFFLLLGPGQELQSQGLVHYTLLVPSFNRHDCAHKSFSRDKLVEDIVGTLAFLPLIYPYEPWRFMHDRHHAKTNM